MEKSRSYEDLRVWQEAIALANAVYVATRGFPKEELYGLTSQLRRCAVSVASNIAEGAARQNRKEFSQFLAISMGSLAELHTQLIIARDNGLLQNSVYEALFIRIQNIRKMLAGLRMALTQFPSKNGQRATENEYV